MGIQGPLTAQALGRSPYDDEVEYGEGQVDANQPPQQYDQRGRPVNPDTKRMNRDIIRAHNEVMQVIGVAEPESQSSSSDAKLRRSHWEYESSVGRTIRWSAERCFEAVGALGLHGLRQRVLVYQHYSDMPFWTFIRRTRSTFSIQGDVLPGAATSFFATYMYRHVRDLCLHQEANRITPIVIRDMWFYVQTHLALFAALQRLGLIPSSQLLPRLSFFVPFFQGSPVLMLPSLGNDERLSIVTWMGRVLLSAAPLLSWMATQRLLQNSYRKIDLEVFRHLAVLVFPRKTTFTTTPPPPAAQHTQRGSQPAQPGLSETTAVLEGDVDEPAASQRTRAASMGDADPAATARRPSFFSVRDNDYASDDDDHEALGATLITIDVEASESADAAAGLWSAELRPSQSSDPRSSSSQPYYLDTFLRQLPIFLASRVFTDALSRLAFAIPEAIALRLVARAFCNHYKIPRSNIPTILPLAGFTWTAFTNFLSVEFFHLAVTSEIWALAVGISQYFYMTDIEWQAWYTRDR
ncbi:hypothetical protein S7711_06048 [Stachybotrys chartarum IBT 7711]|uniref:Uncharacterized protein n=1 Tax=Stachybotrys chartarum (strain CBS 109288 / IBT 7711) TaxID=1280523 RepID=A0A084B208_STACB|nr:hypothetical protein S7711_06048 [Stachybotrys chartarum IBT 7711]